MNPNEYDDIILSMALGRVITLEDIATFMKVYIQWRSE